MYLPSAVSGHVLYSYKCTVPTTWQVSTLDVCLSNIPVVGTRHYKHWLFTVSCCHSSYSLSVWFPQYLALLDDVYYGIVFGTLCVHIHNVTVWINVCKQFIYLLYVAVLALCVVPYEVRCPALYCRQQPSSPHWVTASLSAWLVTVWNANGEPEGRAKAQAGSESVSLRPFHCEGPRSVPSQSMWDMWQTKWQLDKFLCQYFCLPLPVLFYQCFIFIHS